MSALQLSTNLVCPPVGDDAQAIPTVKTDEARPKPSTLPSTPATEQLAPPRKRPGSHRPGAITPRQPLNTLSSGRGSARAPAAAVPHPDAAHHVETQEPAQTRSHTLSAVLTINSTLELDLPQRPDPLKLPELQRIAPDMRKPDARAAAELEAATFLRGTGKSAA